MSFPEYPSYKDSQIAWLGQVPTGWEIKPVAHVATCNDEVLEESTSPDYQMEYVEISNVDADRGIVSKTELSFVDAPSRARRRVREGDVIVSTVRTYLKAIAPIKNASANMIVSTGFAVMRPRNVCPSFLAYVFRAEFLISEIIARSTGISYPAINAVEIRKLNIPVPPEAEQRAIATFLDRETSKIDALVAEQEHLVDLLKEKRQAVISQTVTKGLDYDALLRTSGVEWIGQVPVTWEIVPIRSLFRFVKRQNGDMLDVISVYRDHGVIYKDSRNDNNNKTPEDLSTYQTVRPGDLVVNKMKSWQGSLGISQIHGITSPDYAVFAPVHNGCPEYLNWLLRCMLLPDVYRSLSNGIRPDQWRLEPEKFKGLRIPYPPTDEQRRIAQELQSAVSKFDALVTEAERAISLLRERRSAIISASVTGKIDVRGLVSGIQEAA